MISPLTQTRPRVGRNTREIVLSSVLLPAPFRPTTPTTSPRRTSKLTPFKAQKSSAVDRPFRRPMTYSLSERVRSLGRRYSTLTSWTRIRTSSSVRSDRSGRLADAFGDAGRMTLLPNAGGRLTGPDLQAVGKLMGAGGEHDPSDDQCCEGDGTGDQECLRVGETAL